MSLSLEGGLPHALHDGVPLQGSQRNCIYSLLFVVCFFVLQAALSCVEGLWWFRGSENRSPTFLVWARGWVWEGRAAPQNCEAPLVDYLPGCKLMSSFQIPYFQN